VACLDTTVLIDLLRRRRPRRKRALAKLDELAMRGESLVTTRFNVAELYVGVARANDRNGEELAVRTLLKPFEVLEFNDRAARLFAETTAHLRRLGRPAGDMDVLIAATCLAADDFLVTHNATHFARIPRLVVETY
jgi:tRNA(fMet)-specific endonuclease VapC